ncbi:6-phosphofructokinase [Mycoplasma wenyonii str. Massachusetts]|uniref:6-phosphofructokinase n=1 Tax=Mycoplasma wenyonii (strain Massachusetts) TaxID=1197325 RepID=I6ZIM7_MYCWM|nr:ATP-dependent 6-phosphofructokinase [Mycoplasma wenyonii]AFN65040.1 6-phosphofructokinase [Mycoplasma wenyonii str. Massachusetts]
MRKVAVLTSGGDSPGMNSALYSFSELALSKGYEVVYIENGYQGLIEKRYIPYKLNCLRGRTYNAGTVIGSSRSSQFRASPELRAEGVKALKDQGVEALVVLGGNGSYEGSKLISQLGLPVILLPATIDNDVSSTKYTIGFFSALEEIGQAIKKIWYTANSHSQLTIVEVMGRDCSDLGVFASYSSPLVELVITQQNVPSYEELREKVRKIREFRGNKGLVIVVVEKVLGVSQLPSMSELTKKLEEDLGFTVRGCSLGHTQRGATPTTWEMFVASSFGREAFNSFEAREFDVAIGFDGDNFYRTKLSEVVDKSKGDRISLIESKDRF